MLGYTYFNKRSFLYIHCDYSKISSLYLKNDNIELKQNSKLVAKFPLTAIRSILLTGFFVLSSSLLREIRGQGINLILSKTNFATYLEITPASEGNYPLRKKQYLIGLEQELNIAKYLIAQKIENQLKFLKNNNLSLEVTDLKILKSEVKLAQDSHQLMVIEAKIAKIYFRNIFEKYNWRRRAPRTKEDDINLLLDIGYTLLFNYLDHIIGLFGFDKYKGVHHKEFYNRKSLTCDLIEPFRYIIDKATINMYNLKIYDPKDFDHKSPEVKLNYKISHKYIQYFNQAITKNDELIYNYTQSSNHTKS